MNAYAYAYTKQVVLNALAYIVKGTSNYYKFGEGDSLPNFIIDSINDSGTARECIDKLQAFTYGMGFTDPALTDKNAPKANVDESYNKFLQTLSLYVSYSECVSARILYDNEGKPARIIAIPFQTLRRQGKNVFKYNPLMGYRYKNTTDDIYTQRFNPVESAAQRLDRVAFQLRTYGEQFGDILYYFNKGVGKYYDIYPVPKYYSGIEDIQSDALISTLERTNLESSWQPQVIISTGAIDNNAKGEDNLTAKGRFDRAMKGFTGPNGKKILHIEGNVNEGKPEVKIIDTASMLDQTDKATDRVGRKVCRHMGVPPVLVGFATAGQLGNNQEMLNTMDLFRLLVIKRQDLIKDALHSVWPDKNFDITPLEIFKPATPAK